MHAFHLQDKPVQFEKVSGLEFSWTAIKTKPTNKQSGSEHQRGMNPMHLKLPRGTACLLYRSHSRDSHSLISNLVFLLVNVSTRSDGTRFPNKKWLILCFHVATQVLDVNTRRYQRYPIICMRVSFVILLSANRWGFQGIPHWQSSWEEGKDRQASSLAGREANSCFCLLPLAKSKLRQVSLITRHHVIS